MKREILRGLRNPCSRFIRRHEEARRGVHPLKDQPPAEQRIAFRIGDTLVSNKAILAQLARFTAKRRIHWKMRCLVPNGFRHTRLIFQQEQIAEKRRG